MSEPFTQKLAESAICLKCANYWQSLLRFGVPFFILYNLVDYIWFRFTTEGALGYPWDFQIAVAAFAALVASTIWWLIMREIAALRRKTQRGNG